METKSFEMLYENLNSLTNRRTYTKTNGRRRFEDKVTDVILSSDMRNGKTIWQVEILE